MILFLNIYKKLKELPEIKQIPDSREVKTLKTLKNKTQLFILLIKSVKFHENLTKSVEVVCITKLGRQI